MNKLIVLTSNALRLQFGTDFQFQPQAEAFDKLLGHPDCPVQELQWAGEFEVADKTYYVGGTGPIHSVATQIVMLEK
ncbi:hypothetical protein GWO43_24020 [candidate division KSB1 bacterium]|nr:hypothetical protein [candidate division KSB1 bacterium]NIR73338.1 hypothetical protein [candidate division KSB1 bacterium]NIS27044.1 hypothetical protein [candidate division KSB1 bacterium]NIT73884.1 hypothetical protein [candidate division KSB1 bacterium]NIU27789.1 hypothetical protein [candidate division KSB1 bacterium]